MKATVCREQNIVLDWAKGNSEAVARNETKEDSTKRGHTVYVCVCVCIHNVYVYVYIYMYICIHTHTYILHVSLLSV